MTRSSILLAVVAIFAGVALCFGLLSRRTSRSVIEVSNSQRSPSATKESVQLDSAENRSRAAPRLEDAGGTDANAVAVTAVSFGSIDGVVRASLDSPFSVGGGTARIVRAAIQDGDPHKVAAPPSVALDKYGHFLFERVPLGEWIVRVEPDGFEAGEQRATLSDTVPNAHLAFTSQRNRPTKLTIVLVDEDGKPILESARGADRETARCLQVMLCKSCPVVGENREAQGFSFTHVALSVRDDLRADLTVAVTEAGCVCAMLDEFVVAAAPYLGSQGRIELRVASAQLARLRRSLDVLVIEAQTRLAIANATVSFVPICGGSLAGKSAANGWVHVDELRVGAIDISVEREGYLPMEHRLQLTPQSNEITTIEMTRAVTMSGRFRITDGKSARLPIQLIRVGWSHPAKEPFFTQENGSFSMSGLPAAEYILGLSTLALRSPKRIRAGEAPGWKYVDARDGDVSDIVVDVTEEIVLRSGFVLPDADPKLVERLMRERSK